MVVREHTMKEVHTQGIEEDRLQTQEVHMQTKEVRTLHMEKDHTEQEKSCMLGGDNRTEAAKGITGGIEGHIILQWGGKRISLPTS